MLKAHPARQDTERLKGIMIRLVRAIQDLREEHKQQTVCNNMSVVTWQDCRMAPIRWKPQSPAYPLSLILRRLAHAGHEKLFTDKIERLIRALSNIRTFLLDFDRLRLRLQLAGRTLIFYSWILSLREGLTNAGVRQKSHYTPLFIVMPVCDALFARL